MHPTEAAFQAAIDANRFDFDRRLVFADWLDEQGDKRAAGYRAMGRLAFTPTALDATDSLFYWQDEASRDRRVTSNLLHFLPTDLYKLLRCQKRRSGKTEPDTRRSLEDAFALAFSKLPPDRQAELLSGVLRNE